MAEKDFEIIELDENETEEGRSLTPAEQKRLEKEEKKAARKAEKEAKKAAKAAGGKQSGKKHLKRNIALAAVGILVIYMGISSFLAGKKLPEVSVYTAARGNLQQIVSISGTVVTAEEKGYFARSAVPVAEVKVAMGDTVRKGDVLMTFDPEKLALAKKQAQLQAAAANGDYSNSMEKNAKNNADLQEANHNLPILTIQVDAVQESIDALQIKIDEKARRMYQTGVELQKAIADETAKMQEDPERSKDTLNRLQQLQLDNQLAQQNDQELADWRVQLKDMQQQLAKFQEDKAEMNAQQKSGEAGRLNAGAITAISANQQQTAVTTQDTLASLEAITDGLKADFDGVVTALQIKSGATPAIGMEMLDLQSVEQVKVAVSITKADLSKVKAGQKADVTVAGNKYAGTVSKIAGSATRNSNGVAVVAAEITLDAPDSRVILGAEADVKIYTKKVEDAVALPFEYVNTDPEGDFVYAVQDDVIVRKPITIGVVTDTEMEVTEGLSAGELVTGELPAGVQPGSRVSSKPAEKGMTEAIKTADTGAEGSTEAGK